MLPPNKQSLFPPFATTFDGDPATCSQYLGRARGMLSLMLRSTPPVKSRIEKTGDAEIRVTTNPNHVYIKAGGGISTAFSFGTSTDAETYIYTNSIVPSKYSYAVKLGSSHYWIDAGRKETVSWFHTGVSSGGMLPITYIVYNRKYTLISITFYTLCCMVKARKLYVIAAVKNINNRYDLFLNIYSIGDNDVVDAELSSRSISSDEFIITDGYISRATGCFTVDGTKALIFTHNYTSNGDVHLLEFSLDYTTNTFETVFTGYEYGDEEYASRLSFYNDNIVLLTLPLVSGVNGNPSLYKYNHNTKDFTKYYQIEPQYGLNELLYSSYELGITVRKEMTFIRQLLVGREHLLKIIVTKDGINTTVHESIELIYFVNFNEVMDATSSFDINYAFDGKILAVGFENHPRGYNVLVTPDRKNWALVIDTRATTLLYRVLPVKTPVNEYTNFSVTFPPKKNGF